jgi:arylformamidase
MLEFGGEPPGDAMDLEHEYNMRERVPEHPRIIAQWEQDAANFRRTARAEYDLAYGARPRNRVDVFWPAKDRGSIALFIHGGYWRSFDKSVFSHMAKGLNAHGIAVAVPSYTLCPEVRVGDIIEEMRQLVIYLRNKLKRRIFVFGHSAGGHLAASMLATKWELFGHPNDLVPTAVAISGIFDLRPLLGTSINNDIRIDEGTARVWSPLLWPSPAGRTFEAWVGRKESDEFIRQSRSIIAPWRGAGVHTGYVEIAGHDHFTVLSPFSTGESELTGRLAEMALATQ